MYLRHPDVFHPFKPDHGPFNIHLCSDCGSCQTDPMPSSESLEALYGSYRDGLPDLHRTITADDPQTALYEKCISRIHNLSNRKAEETFTWIDVGGGGGEFSALMAAKFPSSRGIAIDLHSQPKLLNNVSTVEWRQIDINQEMFSANLPQFDVVASIAVLEHVLCPDKFISNLFRLLRPGGMIYLMCPNNASLAGRLLGRRWPYFNPGEHLAIPTPSGVINCLQREWRSFHSNDEHVMIGARPIMLPYTLRYVFRRLGLDRVGKCFPAGWRLPIPSGALEATMTWKVAEGAR
ncbi:class I SAM-dependent methyltransferase [Legionella sp.]|uniref:class I SAM-dependent methyltransferase n=1 Tax=Legionella sp. TaxID=459 RepID=UPI0039E63A83